MTISRYAFVSSQAARERPTRILVHVYICTYWYLRDVATDSGSVRGFVVMKNVALTARNTDGI